MIPVVEIVTDPENGAQSVLVNSVEKMRINLDGTIESFVEGDHNQ